MLGQTCERSATSHVAIEPLQSIMLLQWRYTQENAKISDPICDSEQIWHLIQRWRGWCKHACLVP